MSWIKRPAQPKLDLERSGAELAFQALGGLGVVASFFVVIYYWGDLPSRVPIHLDAAGQPDGWGGRIWLAALPVTSLVLWAGLVLACRIPHQYNYPWKITPENAPRQYRLARILLSAIAACAAVVFATLTFGLCHLATGGSPVLGARWPTLLLGFVLVMLVWYFVAAYRAR